jgi:hypothetical protein
VSRTRTRIAAAATVFGLGGLAGLALGAGQHQPTATVAEKPAIQTKVIRRTIHVTKHAKPKHPAAGPGGGTATTQAGSPGTAYGSATTRASSTGASPSSSSASSPVTTSTSGSTSAPSESGAGSSPVVTHTSGASAGPGGDESDSGEHSGGDDD